MAKHNKWSKVKHRKAVVDKRRGRVWTKISKALMVAAKNGGPDPDSNLSLRYAMDEARYANMPRDTVERAIQKGAGLGDTSQFENVRYEGYAPGGIAVVVDALTDNRTRTIALVRETFESYEGRVGASGCVAHMFQFRGQIGIVGKNLSDDRILEAALDAGADDVVSPDPLPEEDEDGGWTVLTDVPSFNRVKAALEKAGFPIEEASLAMIPQDTVEIAGAQAQSVEDLVEALEELDDVQKVYTNAAT
ncbi:MAG: YebC/PmpR family DNA-binding transcriptional regulator [Phycisphaerales bacterium]